MSTLWVLALGASFGYLAFKRNNVESRLVEATKAYDATAAKAAEGDGATINEIKQTFIKETVDPEIYNERLSAREKQKLELMQEAQAAAAQSWDQKDAPLSVVQGVYLDSPFF
tara:strand:- start:21 stop:359 length:339 start_codon:yes stop_codon:yes gene_type:complete